MSDDVTTKQLYQNHEIFVKKGLKNLSLNDSLSYIFLKSLLNLHRVNLSDYRKPGKQSCGSMSFWCGSGSADPCL
jgi:hypothetical protein